MGFACQGYHIMVLFLLLLSSEVIATCGQPYNYTHSYKSLNVSCEGSINVTEVAAFFSSYTDIESLYFQSSGLDIIPWIICQFTHVNFLYLDMNQMQSLITDQRMPCANQTKILSLKNNNISFISQDYFYVFMNLEYLDLSTNALTWINPALFQSHMPRLTHVDFSYNYLTALDMWMFKLTSVKLYDNVLVNMSHNEINHFENTVGFNINETSDRMCLDLDLRFNKITSPSLILKALNVHTLEEVMRLMSMRLYVDNNPYNCDCDSYEFVKFITPFIPFFKERGHFPLELVNVPCVFPVNLEGMLIIDLSLDQFQCDIEHCDNNKKCDCILTPHNNTMRVDCAGRNLEEIPVFDKPCSWTNYELSLANNSISEIVFKPILVNTTILDLTNNRVSYWNRDTLQYLEKLEILFLQQNKLEGLPEGIDMWKAPLRDAKFGHNPFACNCSNKWIKSWISTEKHPISDLNMIICESPSWNRGTALTKVPLSNFVCDKLNELALALSLGFTALFIIITIFISYVNRKYIYLFLFMRFGWRLGCSRKTVYSVNKQYDVLMYYSDEDHEQALQISDMLEERIKPFRVCLPYREFTPGREIAVNILESIQSSKCTVLLVSNHYLNCQWCKYAFKQAHFEAVKEQNSEIIILLLTKVEQSIMDRDMQVYIKTGTYLKVWDRHFFSKFLMELPHPCGERNQIGV